MPPVHGGVVIVGLRAGCGGRCGGPVYRPLAGPAAGRERACSRHVGAGIGGGACDGSGRGAEDVGLEVRGPVVMIPSEVMPSRMRREVRVLT